MFKKITLFVFLFLVIGIGCFALIERDNLNNNLSNQIEQMEKTYSGKLDSMTAYQTTLVTRINTLESSLAQLSQSYDELNQTYQTAVAQYTLDLEELNTELTGVQNTLSELQASSDVDKAKIEELQNKVAELQQSISEKNVTIDQLNATITAQQATINELNTTIDELIAELNSDLSQQLDFYKKLMEGEVTEIKASDLEGVTKIRDYAFYNCKGTTSVELPNTIEEIGKNAFYILINDENISINDVRFIMPSSIKYLGRNYVDFSINNRPSGSNIFYQGSIKDWASINFETVNYLFSSSDGTRLYIDGQPFTEIRSSDLSGIKEVSSYAFSNFWFLTSVTIPSSVEKIGVNAFSGCVEITSLIFESDSNLSIIENNAFLKPYKLEKLILPQSLTTIGDSVFGFAYALQSCYIPAGVLAVGPNVFHRAYEKNTTLTIYCGATSKPSGWNDYWDYKDYTVKWGYTLEQYLAETTDTTVTA